VDQNRAEFREEGTEGGIIMEFSNNRVIITEMEEGMCVGLNVSLSGNYVRISG
jgi:hypothetical protein